MKKYITRIALFLIVATSLRSYIFLNNESAHLERVFSERSEMIDAKEEVQDERGIFPDVKILYHISKKLGNLLPAS